MWLYKTNEDNTARYILGQINEEKGATLLCFGINPSTACPECLDNTIRKVVKLSANNGYVNWIMVNIYPQRATNPNDLHLAADKKLCGENIAYIEELVKTYPNCDILLAYGNLIKKRDYLKDCLNDILNCLQGRSVRVIKMTKSNNPVHPLYQKDDAQFLILNDDEKIALVLNNKEN